MNNKLVVSGIESLIRKMKEEDDGYRLITYFTIASSLMELCKRNSDTKNIEFFSKKIIRDCGALCGYEDDDGNDYISFALVDLQKLKSFECLDIK